MSTAIRSMPAFETPPVEVKRSLMAVSFALRFAFVGLSLSFAGIIALITGGMDPLNAAVLAVCGGGIAWASIQYVRRWSDAESERAEIFGTPPLPSTRASALTLARPT